MRSRLWIAGAFIGAALSLVGCNNQLQDENAMLKDKNAELQTELDRKNAALDGSENARRSLEDENSRLKMAGTADPSGGTGEGDMNASPTKSKLTGLPKDVTAHVEGNSVVIDIPGDVMFDAGQSTLKSDAKKMLDQVAKSVKSSYPNKKLSIEGFTDTDPIKKQKDKYKDNWELAYERARAVGKYLESKGFSESQFRYVSHGSTEPKNSKKASRRVELAIVDAD